jgi:hypothetical protein
MSTYINKRKKKRVEKGFCSGFYCFIAVFKIIEIAALFVLCPRVECNEFEHGSVVERGLSMRA